MNISWLYPLFGLCHHSCWILQHFHVAILWVKFCYISNSGHQRGAVTVLRTHHRVTGCRQIILADKHPSLSAVMCFAFYLIQKVIKCFTHENYTYEQAYVGLTSLTVCHNFTFLIIIIYRLYISISAVYITNFHYLHVSPLFTSGITVFTSKD